MQNRKSTRVICYVSVSNAVMTAASGIMLSVNLSVNACIWKTTLQTRTQRE